MSDIKFLGDGTAVLVVGEAPAQQTSNDGGLTLAEVPHTTIARLTTEDVDSDQLHDSPPDLQAVAAEAAPVPQESETQSADQLQARIDALVAQKQAAEAAAGQ